MEVFGFDVYEDAVQNVGNDVEIKAEQDAGHVEVVFAAVNPDDAKVFLMRQLSLMMSRWLLWSTFLTMRL